MSARFRLGEIMAFKLKDKVPKAARYKPAKDRLIGCPVSWMLRALPVVKSPKQMVVAFWLWRRHVICNYRSTFPVPNGELGAWGISARTKYRTLELLEAGGVIAINRGGGTVTLTVTILPEKAGR
jgi:hypothetical protein